MIRSILFFVVMLAPVLVQARQLRVDQIPNGARYGCTSCHTSASGGGQFTKFGSDATTALSGEGTVDTRDQDWSLIYDRDSDKDGFTNGEELGDPDGVWRIGDPNPPGAITNPGVQSQRPATSCGDGRITNPEEECEGTDLNNFNCKLLGLDDGVLVCQTDCLFDRSGCGEPLDPENNDNGNNMAGPGDEAEDDAGCASVPVEPSPFPLILLFAFFGFRRAKRRKAFFFGAICSLLFVTGCGTDEVCGDCADVSRDAGKDGSGENDANNGNNQNNVADSGTDSEIVPDQRVVSCLDLIPPANRTRKVVIAHPFVPSYEVLELSEQGVLSETNQTFVMGEGNSGQIFFTPDGSTGYVAQDDGTLGVFRFNQNGDVEVVTTGFDPGFYVSGLAAIRGEKIYAWETGFRDTDNDPATPDGGLYEISIECTAGVPMEGELVAPAKLIWNVDASGETWAIAATDLLGDETEQSLHIYDPSTNTSAGGAQIYTGTDYISSGVLRTKDGLFAIGADTSAFNGEPDRVGVAAIGNGVLNPVQLFDLADPVVMVASPHNNSVLVLSMLADTLNVLDYDPNNAAAPFSIRGPLAVTNPSLLPIAAATVDRGALAGTVLISENVAIRVVRFERNADITNVQFLELSSAVANGAIGIQP